MARRSLQTCSQRRQLGGGGRARGEALGRPAKRGHVHPCEYRHLAKRAQPGADLGDEQLRLLPGREVPALVELVVVDEVGIRLLCPTARRLIELVREDAHGYRDGHTLRVEETELVFPIETS